MTLVRLADAELDARQGVTILLLILVAVSFCSTLAAYIKPFWYDEIFTVILCHLPSASALWKALDAGADSNPPLFYLVVRWTRQLISDDHVGYRAASIFGLLATVTCMYFIQSRNLDRLSALLSAAFVLCSPLIAYGFEARPYSLMLCCISAAILAWQRIEDSRVYNLALA
jgi:hypothetical protein